jgi:hypothetical protein
LLTAAIRLVVLLDPPTLRILVPIPKKEDLVNHSVYIQEHKKHILVLADGCKGVADIGLANCATFITRILVIPIGLLHLAPILGALMITSPVLASAVPVASSSASFFQRRVSVGNWIGQGYLRSQGKKSSEDEDGGLHNETIEGSV